MRDYYFYYLKEFLKKFGPSWYFKWFQPQPVESIREYFGESIGIYFAFVGTYNEMQHIAKKPTEFIHLFIIVIVVFCKHKAMESICITDLISFH